MLNHIPWWGPQFTNLPVWTPVAPTVDDDDFAADYAELLVLAEAVIARLEDTK